MGKHVKMYDSVIGGAGLAGAVTARLEAERGREVLVVEKSNRIAGLCRDSYNDDGVLIHDFGPHIFHTSDSAGVGIRIEVFRLEAISTSC